MKNEGMAEPTEGNWFEIIDELKSAFPHDFKKAKQFTDEHRRFMENPRCFSFVFMVPAERMAFRSGSRRENLEEARNLLSDAKSWAIGTNLPEFQKRSFKALHESSLKNSFSLDLFENMLLLCAFFAFVSRCVASHTSLELIGWFPDSDKMTTIAGSAWSTVAHINFLEAWNQKNPQRKAPEIGIWDHRAKGEASVYDPLIKVPDFFAATLSRWHLSNNKLALPDGVSARGVQRYRELFKAWTPENHRLWLGHIRTEDGAYRAGRVIVARSRSRIRKLSASKSM